MSPASLLLIAALAFGAPLRGPFYVEGPADRARTDATALVREATAAGWSARVVRRYQHGAGWEYLGRIEGFSDETEATEAARALADATGRSLAVYATEEDRTVEVVRVQSTVPLARSDAADPEDLEASELMGRIARAHGGAEGGAAAIDAAERVLYRFRRTVPGGPVVEHTWARQGEDLYLQVDVISGEATPSRVWMLDGKAWSATGAGLPGPGDTTRTQQVLDWFSPRSTLGFPIRIAQASGERPELQQLRRSGTVDVDGTSCERLSYDGERGSDAVTIAVEPRRWLVRQVDLGSEAEPVTHRYRDYRDLGNGLVVPFDVRTWNGTSPVDEIQVLDLDLAPRFPESWFQPPAG